MGIHTIHSNKLLLGSISYISLHFLPTIICLQLQKTTSGHTSTTGIISTLSLYAIHSDKLCYNVGDVLIAD